MAFDLGRGKGGVQPSMNVTPLVDVVLVLLIIFMVVTPLLARRMWMHIPPKEDSEQSPPPPPDALPPIVLTLGSDGQPHVNGELIPRERLIGGLQRMLNARPDKVVFFDASDRAPYGDALALMDFVKGGGIETLAVLAENLADAEAAAGATPTQQP
ncbi:MAG: biopolymer transporter ExbD [Myxococcaceae bacterium]|nr:biopolymer transporter ExbD [Myxococcaceae bacterium]